MRSVIFAAGLGTRLYPLTKSKPKALVEVGGIPMLGRILKKMQDSCIRDVVVNVHAFADDVESYINEYSASNPDMHISVSDERELLLETGGGLKKMRSLLEDDSFLVHNVDVISDIDLKALMNADRNFYDNGMIGRESGNASVHLATLAVRKIESDRYFLFNEKGILCGWENVKTGERKISRPGEENLRRYGFTGIHVIHPELFSLMTEEGVFSITDVYLRLASEWDIHMYDASDSVWYDIGSQEQLKKAELETGKSSCL